MKNNTISKTMYAVAYLRSEELSDPVSHKLAEDHLDTGKAIADYINDANGGMFTANVITRDYYFKKVLNDNQDLYDQLIILGVGLDTKADSIAHLKQKKVFGIDICANAIKDTYKNKEIATSIHFYEKDLTQISSSFIDDLEQAGFCRSKRSYIIWEGGTFYLTPDKTLSILEFFAKHCNLVGISIDCLNGGVFFDENHPKKDIIKQVLSFLSSDKEPWLGFFQKEQFEILKNWGFESVDISDHGTIERNINATPVMEEDLIFFLTVLKDQ